MSNLTVAAPVPGDRAWLERKTEFILTLAYRQACDIIRIGAELEEVKRTIGHGSYQRWVEERMPFSVQHARKCRQVAKAFAAYQSAQFERFDPSALYVLAQVQGVKPEVRAHAVQLAEAGERITHAKALQIIDAHKPVADLSAGELRRYDDLKRDLNKRPALDRDGAVRYARDGGAVLEDAEGETERIRARDALEHEAIGRLLVRALREFTSVRFERVVDWEREDDAADDLMFSVVAYSENAAPRAKSQADPRLLLEQLLGVVRTKHCNGGCCPTPLDEIPIAEFCRNKDQPDGRNPRCRKCEAARKTRDRAKKKATAGAAPAAPVQPPPG